MLPRLLQVLSCLATLLRKQDLEAWGYPVTLQVYHGLLSFTVHAKPKVSLLGLGTGGSWVLSGSLCLARKTTATFLLGAPHQRGLGVTLA